MSVHTKFQVNWGIFFQDNGHKLLPNGTTISSDFIASKLAISSLAPSDNKDHQTWGPYMFRGQH